ncbi:methyltransferase domain-containing protein, partial [Thioclava sp. BHET1]
LSKMLDILDIQRDELVLDLGVGLGYSSAIISHLAEAVVAVEVDEALAAEAQAALSAQGVDNVAVVCGPLGEGAPKHGPYDVMTVEGAVEEMPQSLVDQLKEGGRIAAFFNDGALGSCRIGHKNGGKINWRHAFNAAAPVLPGFEKRHAFVL